MLRLPAFAQTSRQVSEIPDGYVDGCTCFFDQFGGVSHADLCNEHDRQWYWSRAKKRPGVKAKADTFFCWRMCKRHALNTPYQLVVWPSMVLAFFYFIGPLSWIQWRWK